jgi:hypothetical protein
MLKGLGMRGYDGTSLVSYVFFHMYTVYALKGE